MSVYTLHPMQGFVAKQKFLWLQKIQTSMDMGGTSNFEDFEMETWLEEQNDLGDYPDGFNPELWGL